MLNSGLVASTLSIGIAATSVNVACAQSYPYKPIRIIAAEPGGSGDFNARIIAQGLTDGFSQPVIVDNRGGPLIVAPIVARALPDGYTLLVQGVGVWTLPFMQKVSYDPVRDLLPVSAISSAANVLVVHPSVPAKSVKELIALARAEPGKLNYAQGTAGSTIHLSAELFTAMAHVDIVRVPYKGTAQAVNDVLGGQVQLMFPSAVSVVPHIKSGRLTGLAVTSAQPSKLYPGLPTVAAAGVPGYESVSTIGIWAPAKTAATTIGKLNKEIVRALNAPGIKERFLNIGSEVVASTPEQFAATIKSDMLRMGKLIKDANIRTE